MTGKRIIVEMFEYHVPHTLEYYSDYTLGGIIREAKSVEHVCV